MAPGPALTIRLEIGLDSALQVILQAWFNRQPQTPALDRIERKVDKIMASTAEITAALDKIDSATSKIGANVQIVADTLQVVSSEVDAFKAALAAAGGYFQHGRPGPFLRLHRDASA